MFLPISQKIDYPLRLRKCLRVNLGVTTGHDEERIGAEAKSLSNHLPWLEIGTMGNRAGVDDGDIRQVSERDGLVSLVFQGIDDGFRFELIDFTAQSGNGNSHHGSTGKSAGCPALPACGRQV